MRLQPQHAAWAQVQQALKAFVLRTTYLNRSNKTCVLPLSAVRLSPLPPSHCIQWDLDCPPYRMFDEAAAMGALFNAAKMFVAASDGSSGGGRTEVYRGITITEVVGAY